jgi:hypothetical protein
MSSLLILILIFVSFLDNLFISTSCFIFHNWN